MSFQIRPAQLSDAPEIARLSRALGYPNIESEIASRLQALLLFPHHFVSVATEATPTLLGWVAAERRLILESGEKVEIVGLVVDATRRRAGVGQALISAVEQWAAAQSVSTLLVSSNVVRTESHLFYETLGYVHMKTQHSYAKLLGLPSNPLKPKPLRDPS